MSDDRKTPLWPWIVALLIGLPVLYIVSFGPACWAESQTFGRTDFPTITVPRFHRPLLRIANGRGIAAQFLVWYANLGAHPFRTWDASKHGELEYLQYYPPPPTFGSAR